MQYQHNSQQNIVRFVTQVNRLCDSYIEKTKARLRKEKELELQQIKKTQKRIIPSRFDLPRKPISAYLQFYNERRQQLKDQYKSLPMTQIARIASIEWKNLPRQDQEQYIYKYEQDKIRYETELQLFRVGNREKYIWQMNPIGKVESKEYKLQQKKDNFIQIDEDILIDSDEIGSE